jgi:hypothetical protein
MTFEFHNLSEINQETRKLIEFPLGGKVNGKIAGLSMSLASERPVAPGIDGHNEFMAELEAMEATANSFYEQGSEQTDKEIEVRLEDGEVRVFKNQKQVDLARWRGVREEMISLGMKVQPISGTFSYILTSTAEREQANVPTPNVAQKIAEKDDNIDAESVITHFQRRATHQIDRTKLVIKRAMDIIGEIPPMRDGETPEELPNILDDACKSARKSAYKTASNAEEALGSMYLINDFQETL